MMLFLLQNNEPAAVSPYLLCGVYIVVCVFWSVKNTPYHSLQKSQINAGNVLSVILFAICILVFISRFMASQYLAPNPMPLITTFQL